MTNDFLVVFLDNYEYYDCRAATCAQFVTN